MSPIRQSLWSGSALAALVGMIAVLAVLAGCGGGNGGSPAADSVDLPEPKQPISELVPVLERAVSERDCEGALQVVHPALLPQSEHPQSKRNCEEGLFRLSFIGDDFEAADSQQMGAAAIVDGEQNGNDVALAWVIDEHGGLKWIGGHSDSHQVGTEPTGAIDFDGAAAAFIDALRDEDCETAFDLIAADTRLSSPDVAGFCRNFADIFTAAPESFASRLQQDPDAEPVAMGATSDLAFYGVATEPVGFRTLVLISVFGVEARVFDVLPAAR